MSEAKSISMDGPWCIERRKIGSGREVLFMVAHTDGHWRARVVAVDGGLFMDQKCTPPMRTRPQLNAHLLENGFSND